jgi:uncharacterized protein (TIGR02996 family)
MGTLPAIPAEQAALLAAIVADPDDDTPRLAYADWLDENGDDEQATFIRESITGVVKKPGPRRAKKEAALRVVAGERGKTWLKAVGVEYVTPWFVRGFAEQLTFELPDLFFLATEQGLFRVVPVRAVTIGAEKDFGPNYKDVRRLAAMPELGRLHTLNLSGSARVWAYAEPDPEAWPRFFASEHIRGLRRLGLCQCIADDAAVALAASPSLAGLRTLALAHNGVGVAGFLAILRSPHLANLTELWLDGFDDGEPGAPDVLASLAARFGSGLYLTEYPED